MPTTLPGYPRKRLLRRLLHIFAIARRDGLVLKLAAYRVDELIADGSGERFGAGKGKPMKDCVVMSPESRKHGRSIAKEALAFVRGQSRGRQKS